MAFQLTWPQQSNGAGTAGGGGGDGGSDGGGGGAGDGSNGGRIPQGQLGEARGAIRNLWDFDGQVRKGRKQDAIKKWFKVTRTLM